MTKRTKKAGKRVALNFNMARVHQQGIVRGVIEYAALRNWKLFGSFWTLDGIKDLRRWDGDGVIAAVEDPSAVKILQRSGLPVVDMADMYPNTGFSLVTNDNYRTGRLAGEHFLAAGLERFAYCGVEDAEWSAKRLAGLRQSVGVEDGMIAAFNRPAAWWQGAGTPRELARFLRQLAKPVGIMAANDTAGVRVTGACRDIGLHVPDEVAVVGVDNEDILCLLSPTHLSSIPFDRREIGFRAAERLDVLMRRLVRFMPPLAVPPLPMVARASSETIISEDPLVRQAMTIIRERGGKLNVMELHSALHVSRRNLERRFKTDTGRGLLEEIHRCRINQARRIIRETELPLSKIAALSGFSSPARFSAAFLKYCGQTPQAYRTAQGIMQR